MYVELHCGLASALLSVLSVAWNDLNNKQCQKPIQL